MPGTGTGTGTGPGTSVTGEVIDEGLPEEKEMKVPTTFNEMLLFNASVMGYGASTWMSIVLVQFDDMVRNVANFTRLQEECDVMSLVLAKYKGKILLTEFKAVTLASLRSLLPQEHGCVLNVLHVFATGSKTERAFWHFYVFKFTTLVDGGGVGWGGDNTNHVICSATGSWGYVNLRRRLIFTCK